ncbi:toll/interleukin-1 receptor domain-containing protein (plasmid) [Microvirga terrae]|uniref:Toll/interleukin-1 receptor domain-containing protein n=1 Tax=Microvirga terrae TaxID=2740529 RepID=A0ABY5RZW1_9HYPH|nr:toll/interleukin-1 receptor domain-containing protein [Microvirga terrae]UVF22786.1 toll/interleukin-1 receptor domain-containing protein [Microvirga terrae]
MPANAFISYSHADEKYLERLHKHLSVLRREGDLQDWSDHKILAGSKLGDTISANLNESTLFIALLSPDYLASTYCYEKEFEQARKMHEQGRIRIVPIILEPCDWLASPFSEFMALPKDGLPISEWTNPNNAFLNIVTGLRRIIEGMEADSSGRLTPVVNVSPTTGRRPRVKQDFDSIQKAEFADGAFATIRHYFERSCAELHDLEGQIRAKFEPMSPTAFTCTVVNRGKRSGGEAHITVHNSKGRRHGMGDISYVYERHAGTNTANGWISVEADDYNLYLEHHGGFHSFGGRDDAKLTPEQVAETLWNDFVRQAGIEYE